MQPGNQLLVLFSHHSINNKMVVLSRLRFGLWRLGFIVKELAVLVNTVVLVDWVCSPRDTNWHVDVDDTPLKEKEVRTFYTVEVAYRYDFQPEFSSFLSPWID